MAATVGSHASCCQHRNCVIGTVLSLRLPSRPVGDDDTLYFKRQGFWLRMARERAGKSQKGAAEVIGLSENSKSTISDYENGIQQAPQQVLRTLARWYGVPVRVFLDPRPTADEVIEDLLSEAVRLGEAAEQRGWAAGQGQGPEADDGQGGEPGRLSA